MKANLINITYLQSIKDKQNSKKLMPKICKYTKKYWYILISLILILLLLIFRYKYIKNKRDEEEKLYQQLVLYKKWKRKKKLEKKLKKLQQLDKTKLNYNVIERDMAVLPFNNTEELYFKY